MDITYTKSPMYPERLTPISDESLRIAKDFIAGIVVLMDEFNIVLKWPECDGPSFVLNDGTEMLLDNECANLLRHGSEVGEFKWCREVNVCRQLKKANPTILLIEISTDELKQLENHINGRVTLIKAEFDRVNDLDRLLLRILGTAIEERTPQIDPGSKV